MAVEVIQLTDRYSLVALSGQLTQMGVERITGELYTATVKRNLPAIIDLSEVSFMASAGLGLLASVRKQLQKHDAEVVLLHANEQVAQTIRTSRLDVLFPIVDTLDEALAHLGLDAESDGSA